MTISFSSSHFKNWERCPKKFELDTIENLQWPTNPKGFQLGLAVHQMMDWQANYIPEEHYLGLMPENVQTVYKKLVECAWGQLEVVESEWPFLINLNGVWVEGRIDRIAKGSVDGAKAKVWILDWKTGTAIPKDPVNDWQTKIYFNAVYQLQQELGLDLIPEELGFCYVQANLEKPGVETAIVEYSEQKYQQDFEEIKNTSQQMLNAMEYPLPNECPDAYCPYNPVCGIRG